MKKLLAFLCLVCAMFMLVGCSGVNPDNYEIDKEITIKENLSLEEAEAKIDEAEEAEDDSIVYMTIEYVMTMEGLTEPLNMVVKFDLSGNTIKAEGTISSTDANGTIYIADGYIYTNITAGAMTLKYKYKMETDTSIIDEFAETVDFSDLIGEYNLTAETEGLKVGFDSRGCFIFDYAKDTAGVKIRFVVDGNKPVYAYFSESSSMTIEMKYSYGRVSIQLPNDLDTYPEF